MELTDAQADQILTALVSLGFEVPCRARVSDYFPGDGPVDLSDPEQADAMRRMRAADNEAQVLNRQRLRDALHLAEVALTRAGRVTG